MRKVAVYGWGVVAPGARDLAEFEALTIAGRTVLTPDNRLEMGSGIFHVGQPEFEFEEYRPWIAERHGEAYVSRLQAKMGDNALFAIGATIQALESNPGLEAAVRDADVDTQVLIGSGVGDIPRTQTAYDEFRRAERAWYRFWAHPSRCPKLHEYLETGRCSAEEPVPTDPRSLEPDSEERFDAVYVWNRYWASLSPQREAFERQYAEAEQVAVGENLTTGPTHAIQERKRRLQRLRKEYGCPHPPWDAVSPNLLWAIQNIPAAQITMLLHVHGPAFAPVAACSTFGVALKLGFDAIQTGAAKVAIVGSTDPRPERTLMSAFHQGRLAPAGGNVNYPLTTLRGTHVSGGACIWVIADEDYMGSKGVSPVGPRIASIKTSSDAHHIITPSPDGPKQAIRTALATADVKPKDIAVWDMHATGTPGDASELKLTEEFIGEETALTARKGMFGHGMANAAGWELTAMAIDLQRRCAYPFGVTRDQLHPALRDRFQQQLVTEERALADTFGVKMMLGIGGITACVILRYLPPTTA